MYHHLLVPIDDSLLSTEVVRQSVVFAKTLGAKVTFFHAREDYGASSVAALERVIWPAAYNEQMAGEAAAILSKASVVAREAGIEHDVMEVTADRPYEAILRAAEARGCDLIFIASHGRRGLKGLVLGSQTQKVLQQTTIPVLVAAVESNVPAAELIPAVAVLRDEHRSLAAVVHGLELLAHEVRAKGEPPHFQLLKAIVYYIREFPEKMHHPKEDDFLFKKLRERTSEFNEVLDELQRQHGESGRYVDALADAIDRYEADPEGGYEQFLEAVQRFATGQEQHMRLETRVIIPAAREYLTAEDWAEVGRAFADNGDPRFHADTEDEFRHLFVQIQNLAPAAQPVAVRR